jgi:hypothetical protein
MGKCAHCSAETWADSINCPRCGKPVAKRGLSLGGFLGIFFAVLFGLFYVSEQIAPSKPSIADSGEAGVQGPPIEASAIELLEAYEANEARAQAQYGDRPIAVTGVVKAIDLDLTDDPTVRLGGKGSQYDTATLQLDEATAPKAVTLDKGQELRAVCSEVTEVIGTPILRECRF